jgi:hypothetical protein
MSLIIKIAGADFSASGLPKLKASVFGFDAEGLLGLYLFEDGVIDTSHPGPFLDSSGRNNDAVVFSDFASPIQRGYGLEVADTAGLIIDTGIIQSAEFTVVACLRNTIDSSVVSGYPTWFGDTGNNIPSKKSAQGTNQPRLTANMQITTSVNRNGIFSLNGLMMNGRTRYDVSEANYGSASAPAVMSMRVGGDSVSFKTVSGYSVSETDVDISQGYLNLSDTMTVGLWGHAGLNSGISAELYGFAIYDRALSDAEMAEAMAAMNARVSARGVVVVS